MLIDDFAEAAVPCGLGDSPRRIESNNKALENVRGYAFCLAAVVCGIMQEKTPPAADSRRAAEWLRQEASRLDGRASAFARHAADCERWGLCGDAGAARSMARALRIDAMAQGAMAVALLSS